MFLFVIRNGGEVYTVGSVFGPCPNRMTRVGAAVLAPRVSHGKVRRAKGVGMQAKSIPLSVVEPWVSPQCRTSE